MLKHDAQADPVFPTGIDDGLRRRNRPLERFFGQDMFARCGNARDQVLSLIRGCCQNDRINTSIIEESLESFNRLEVKTIGKVLAPFLPARMNTGCQDLSVKGFQRLSVGHRCHPGAHDGDSKRSRHVGKPFVIT